MAVQVLFTGLGPAGEQQHRCHQGCGEQALHGEEASPFNFRRLGLDQSQGIGGIGQGFVTITSYCFRLIASDPIQMQQLPLF